MATKSKRVREVKHIPGIFTTTEAAELLRVSSQTVMSAFDSGQLKGFRIPGSSFRKIPQRSLLAAMTAQGLKPKTALAIIADYESIRSAAILLIASENSELNAECQKLLTSPGRPCEITNAFRAGVLVATSSRISIAIIRRPSAEAKTVELLHYKRKKRITLPRRKLIRLDHLLSGCFDLPEVYQVTMRPTPAPGATKDNSALAPRAAL